MSIQTYIKNRESKFKLLSVHLGQSINSTYEADMLNRTGGSYWEQNESIISSAKPRQLPEERM